MHMETTRRIETHQDGRSVELPVFDGERVAPDRKLFEGWLQAALERRSEGIQIGEAFTRPVKAAQPIPVNAFHLKEAGVGHLVDERVVQNHQYLAVEGADGQRFQKQDFERGAWLGGRRAPAKYKDVEVEVDSQQNKLWIVTYSREKSRAETGRVAVPFPQDLRGPSTTVRLFDDTLAATQVESPALDELLSTHFGRPVRMVRVDQMVVAGDPALPEGVRTRVWANDGAPLHILSEESIAHAEYEALRQKGREVIRLPYRPWRPDFTLKASNGALVPHIEDEIALWAIPVDGGGHALIQTIRGTPRCIGMQGQYGVVSQYRPKEPRDRRDGKDFGDQRPLFGVNAAVWGGRFGGQEGVIRIKTPVIPIAARPVFEERWEGKWMS